MLFQCILYQNEELALLRPLVPLHSQTRERQDTASNHDRCSLEKEVIPQLSHMLQEVASLVKNDELAIHVEQRVHHVTHLLTADPLTRADERGGLVSNPDESLLDLRVRQPSHDHLCDRRNRTLHVVAVGEEGEEGLQRPIGAAPSLVLLSLLQVVIIGVVALNDTRTIERSQTKMNGAKRLFGRNRRKQTVGVSEEGPILSYRKAFLWFYRATNPTCHARRHSTSASLCFHSAGSGSEANRGCLTSVWRSVTGR